MSRITDSSILLTHHSQYVGESRGKGNPLIVTIDLHDDDGNDEDDCFRLMKQFISLHVEFLNVFCFLAYVSAATRRLVYINSLYACHI